MDRLSSAGMLVARILLSGIFLVSSVKQVFAFSAAQGYIRITSYNVCYTKLLREKKRVPEGYLPGHSSDVV